MLKISSFSETILSITKDATIFVFLDPSPPSINDRNGTHQIVKMSPPELKQAKYTEHRIEHKIRTQKRTYNVFQKKRFQILCIQTLFDRMRKSLEDETPISQCDQSNILASLYHFFEMNLKNVKIEDYVNFHKIIPNPSATIIHLQYRTKPT